MLCIQIWEEKNLTVQLLCVITTFRCKEVLVCTRELREATHSKILQEPFRSVNDAEQMNIQVYFHSISQD